MAIFTSLTDTQQVYLNGLREGKRKESELILRPKLLQTPHLDDFAFFREFLQDNGNSTPDSRDLALRVPKQTVQQLLAYFDSRNCLGIQTCFGFDKPIAQGGQVQLLHKGSFYTGNPPLPDPEVWNNFYITNQNGFNLPEMYINLDQQQSIRVTKARQYLKQFRAYYPGRTIRSNPYIHGVTLPVKSILNLLSTDPDYMQAETLTFQWGLTVYYPGERTMGNMTLLIGTDGFVAGPIIEIRTEEIAGPGLGDCPPKSPC
ncbi:hypothetical protein GCM10028807_42060 [Spirosoma daeguense]